MIGDNKPSYILITPSKNEEENLPKLIESVVNQTIIPSLWVIVDDGSTDNSSSIIKDAMKKHGYIRSIRLKEGSRDLGIHYAYVCKQGFDYATKFCENNDINYNYVSLLDADIQLGKSYFEKLIKEFERNPKLGIASGDIYYQTDDGLCWEKTRRDLPRGANRIWRRICFEETEGFKIVHSPDTVSNIKAKLRGWETKQFKDIISIQTRPTSSAEGLWKGYKIKGEGAYYLRCHPLHVLLKGLKYLLQPRFYLSFAYFSGYLSGFIQRKRRIEDEEIKNYFRKQRLKELVNIYLKNKKV